MSLGIRKIAAVLLYVLLGAASGWAGCSNSRIGFSFKRVIYEIRLIGENTTVCPIGQTHQFGVYAVYIHVYDINHEYWRNGIGILQYIPVPLCIINWPCYASGHPVLDWDYDRPLIIYSASQLERCTDLIIVNKLVTKC